MNLPAIVRLVLAVVLAFALVPPMPAAHAVWTIDAGKITVNLNAVAVADDVIFAAGEAGTILRSTDAGATWDRVNSATGHTITGIDFADSQNGWAVTLAGAVFRTTDGGQSWSLISNDLAGLFYVAEQMHGISALSTSVVAVVEVRRVRSPPSGPAPPEPVIGVRRTWQARMTRRQTPHPFRATA